MHTAFIFIDFIVIKWQMVDCRFKVKLFNKNITYLLLDFGVIEKITIVVPLVTLITHSRIGN